MIKTNKEEFTGEEMLEAMIKLRPEKLNDDTRKLFYTIMEVIDERDNLQKGNISLQEDIENYRASVQALKVELDKKDKTIKEAIDYIKNNTYKCQWGDLEQDNEDINISDDLTETEFIEELLQILERADK